MDSDGETRRSTASRILIGLLGFVGVTALGGGIEMLAFPLGNDFVPRAWLDHVPVVETWVLPGIVLGSVFGIGSLCAAVGLWRRRRQDPRNVVERATGRHWSWAASLVIGALLFAWIMLEVVFIPERSVIEALYLSVSVAIVWLTLRSDVREEMALSRPGADRGRVAKHTL